MKNRANNDHLTLGIGKKPFKNHLARVGWAAAGLLGAVLALPAWAQTGGGGAGAAVRAPAAAPMAGASTPAQTPATAPVPAQPPAPRWGEGVLERAFLVQLRRFLETDPFDMKVLSELAGQIEIDPKDGPRADGTWGARSVKVRWPLGASFGNRSGGGAQFAYAHDRSGSYLRMEFVKVSFGDHEKLHQPCLTMDQFMEVFDAPGWTNGYLILRYADGLPVYGPRQFQTTAASGVAVRFIPQGGGGCSPYLYVNFDRLPPHPATKQ